MPCSGIRGPVEVTVDVTTTDFLLAIIFVAIAIVYASVGQAGATGYIAVMAIAGLGPDMIRPTALALNIVVAAIGTIRFAAAGLLTWRTCYPFAMLGVCWAAASICQAASIRPSSGCCCCSRPGR